MANLRYVDASLKDESHFDLEFASVPTTVCKISLNYVLLR